jgi:hypothetical protein
VKSFVQTGEVVFFTEASNVTKKRKKPVVESEFLIG